MDIRYWAEVFVLVVIKLPTLTARWALRSHVSTVETAKPSREEGQYLRPTTEVLGVSIGVSTEMPLLLMEKRGIGAPLI